MLEKAPREWGGGNSYFTGLFTRLLDEGRRILRLYYQSFDDKLPRQYVDEHEAMVAAIEAGKADLADTLAGEHAGQILRQIQSYIALNWTEVYRFEHTPHPVEFEMYYSV